MSDWDELRRMCMSEPKLKVRRRSTSVRVSSPSMQSILNRSATKEEIARDLTEFFDAQARLRVVAPDTPRSTPPPRPTSPPPPPPPLGDLSEVPLSARAQLQEAIALRNSDGYPAVVAAQDAAPERKISLAESARKQSAREYYRERTLELSRTQDHTLVLEAYKRRALHPIDANTRLDTLMFCVPVSPLLAALELNLLESARQLLVLGANANERLLLSGLRGAQASLLHYAAFSLSGFDAARLLLAHGADPNMQDNYGCTPLHVACFRGHKNLVLLLLSTGADVRARDILNEEPIDKAVRSGHTEIQELLRQRGASARLAPMAPLPAPTALRMLLVGHSGVGKTSFMRRFLTNSIDDKERPSVGVTTVTKNVAVDGLPYELTLLDAAGQARYRSVVPLYYANAQLAVVFYDARRPETFAYAKHLLTELATSLAPHAALGLVATKVDQGARVSRDEAAAWAAERRLVFAETSALTEGLAQPVMNVREVLSLMVQEWARTVGRFPAPPPAVVAERAVQCPPCRVVDLQYGRRMDYRHQLSARLLSMNPFHKGWLTKKGHWVQSWRRRYCVIKDHFLYYYLTETDETPRGFIPIYSCSVKENAERPFAFEIHTASTPLSRAHPAFVLAADGAAEKEEWIEAIEAAKLFAEQLRSRMPEARKWLTALRPTFTDTFYVTVDFRPSVEAQTLLLTSLGLPAAESITLRIRLDSAVRLFKSPNAREILLTNGVDLRLLLLDSSTDGSLLSFLQRSAPPAVVFGAISPADYLLNCQLSYLLTVERLPYPLLKPIADQLGSWSALLASGARDAPALRVCDLNNAEFSAPDIDGLTQALAFYPLCTRLELRECTFDDYGFAILMEELCERRETNEVDLKGANLTSAQLNALAYMLPKNRNLLWLSLADASTGPTGAELVLNALCTNKALTHLDLSGIPLCADAAIAALARLFEQNASITSLKLQNCDLVEASGARLLPALLSNHALESIDVGTSSLRPLLEAPLARNRTERESQKQQSGRAGRGSVRGIAPIVV